MFAITVWFLLAASLQLEASSQPDSAALKANSWQWISFSNPVEQFQIEAPEKYTLLFNKEGTVSIGADCNRAAGSYKADGNSLTIAIGPMTMAACPPESRSDRFVHLLGGAASYAIVKGNLQIGLMADGGTMIFSPEGGQAIEEGRPQTETSSELKTEGIVSSYSDYYVGKFNQNSYQSFLHKQMWTTDMLQVALKIPGTSLNECKSVIIEILKPSAEESETSVILITLDGLMDDSVRAKKYKLNMKRREEGWWEVSQAKQAQSCWPQRGHQEFSGDPCN